MGNQTFVRVVCKVDDKRICSVSVTVNHHSAASNEYMIKDTEKMVKY